MRAAILAAIAGLAASQTLSTSGNQLQVQFNGNSGSFKIFLAVSISCTCADSPCPSLLLSRSAPHFFVALLAPALA